MEKSHWRQTDFRKDSLYQIIKGIDSSINLLQQRREEYEWYDGLFFADDCEPIYGLAFIAFQNYINGSIKDLHESTNEKTKFYKVDLNLAGYCKSRIELIIGIANFIKHKDDGKLHKGTQEILDHFGLKHSNEITESAVFEGLTMLSKQWNLLEVYEIVTNWREKLYKDFEQHCL